MNQSDNITAFASAIGGAVTVIRLSGPQVLDIANRVWRGRTALSAANVRKMMLGRAAGDQVLAEVPLVAAEDVARLTFWDLFVTVLRKAAMAK